MKLKAIKSYVEGSKPLNQNRHEIFRCHFAGQLAKMCHDDPHVLEKIVCTDETYFRMHRGSTRHRSYEISISDKPYRNQGS